MKPKHVVYKITPRKPTPWRQGSPLGFYMREIREDALPALAARLDSELSRYYASVDGSGATSRATVSTHLSRNGGIVIVKFKGGDAARPTLGRNEFWELVRCLLYDVEMGRSYPNPFAPIPFTRGETRTYRGL